MRRVLLAFLLAPAVASAAPMLPILPGVVVVEPAAPPVEPDPCRWGCPV